MDKFWMIYGGYCNPPSFKHSTEQGARQEAERLARKHSGQKFYILEVIATCCLKEFIWEEFSRPNERDIPF